MPRAHTFEDLKTWQLGRELVQAVYQLTKEPTFKSDPALRDQLRRAAVSGMANIAEGFERSSKKEFIRFLYMAKGSSGEVRSHLYAAGDLKYIDNSNCQRVQQQAVRLSKSLFSFISHLENPGSK